MPKRINQTLDETSGWGRFLADLRGHINGHKNWGNLAIEAGLSPQTISKLAYGETKTPRGDTIFKLMVAFGREKELLEASHSDEPVVVKEAVKLRPPKHQRRSTALRLREERRKKIFPHRKGKDRVRALTSKALH